MAYKTVRRRGVAVTVSCTDETSMLMLCLDRPTLALVTVGTFTRWGPENLS
jgi:hypothetical protein